MLEPVTDYCQISHKRIVNIDRYRYRINEDLNMLDIENLKSFGNTAFTNLNNIIDLNLEKPKNAPLKEMQIGSLYFTPLGLDETEFYLGFNPVNGLRSLRRGYYKILFPGNVINNGIEIWQADVLFCQGINNSSVYKYNCNIGPLVNMLAVGRSLAYKKFINNSPLDKYKRLCNTFNSVFYISSAQLVRNERYSTPSKEMLWFVW